MVRDIKLLVPPRSCHWTPLVTNAAWSAIMM